MPRWKVIVLGAALVSVTASPLAAAQVTMVGPWRILSGVGSAGPYCTMQIGTVGEKFLGVQVRPDGTTFLSVGDPGWAFTPRQQTALQVTIDGAPVFSGNALAVLPNILVFPSPAGKAVVDTVARGKSLSANVGSAAVTFDLAGAPAAREAENTCLAAAKR